MTLLNGLFKQTHIPFTTKRIPSDWFSITKAISQPKVSVNQQLKKLTIHTFKGSNRTPLIRPSGKDGPSRKTLRCYQTHYKARRQALPPSESRVSTIGVCGLRIYTCPNGRLSKQRMLSICRSRFHLSAASSIQWCIPSCLIRPISPAGTSRISAKKPSPPAPLPLASLRIVDPGDIQYTQI